MIRAIFQYFWMPFYRRWAMWRIQQERTFEYEGLQLKIPPGVFHPGIFFSSKIFIRFLQSVDFQQKRVLDIGTGSGILALFAVRNGAIATALDINPSAVKSTLNNAANNGLDLTVLESDLFDELPPQSFDFILINPPYFPRQARDLPERAFFAGENLEYFDNLFAQMPAFLFPKPVTKANNPYPPPVTHIWMILSEDCDFLKMQSIAGKNGFRLRPVFEKKKWGERFFIAQAEQN